MSKRGFVLGKFMPPHAGHIALCRAAAAMVDELTILVCGMPGDTMTAEQRAGWMREIFPNCRVIHFCGDVPQHPDDSDDFWPIWKDIVAEAHPEPIDLVFAGEGYGAQLAQQVGGTFIPLGARVLGADTDGIGGLSGSAIRGNLPEFWQWLPAPVRRDSVGTIVLHGAESVGKSTLAKQLAQSLNTPFVPEYGRSHCEIYRDELTMHDLTTIAAAHQAMITAAREWSGPVLISDTDWLMTRAWSMMLLGEALPGPAYPLADLYLYLPPNLPWVDDGTRVFGEDRQRIRFDELCRAELAAHDVKVVQIDAPPEERLTQALAAIAAL